MGETGTDELRWEKRSAELGQWMVGQAMLKTQSEKYADLRPVLEVSEKTIGKLKKGFEETPPAARLSFPRRRKKR